MPERRTPHDPQPALGRRTLGPVLRLLRAVLARSGGRPTEAVGRVVFRHYL